MKYLSEVFLYIMVNGKKKKEEGIKMWNFTFIITCSIEKYLNVNMPK